MAYIEDQLFKTIEEKVPGFCGEVIFDVGANVGQSSSIFLNKFTDAEIWAFEPISASHRELSARFEKEKRVHCINSGLGAFNTNELFYSEGTSVGNRKVPGPTPNASKSTETVKLVSGDHFCGTHEIHHINYLKIDTEGQDLDVLRGFCQMLNLAAIDFIQLEVSMHPGNPGHVRFELAKNFMEVFEYVPFLITDQTFETRGRAHLRRCDSIFISKKLASPEYHRKP